MIDDERLDPALLAAYEAPEPSSDLGARFVARLAPPMPDLRRRYLAAGAALVLVAAMLVLLIARRVSPASQAGSASATARVTEKVGDRGIAVLEAGAALTWDAARATHVHQDRGDVFYRVERAGDPFEVATAQGVVRVRGTCFRVVLEKLGTTVTVYEGSVELANARGQIILAAGDRALATNDQPPRMLSGATLAAAPVPTATLDELLARDRAQRERIAALEAQIGSAARTTDALAGQRAHHAFEMSHDELVALAKRCMVPHEISPLAGSTVMDTLIDKGAAEVGLTADERAAVARVIERTQPPYEEGLRSLYADLTGETGASLDPITLIMEITQKSPAADTAVAYQRIAAERVAGAVKPTADAKSAVIERYVRFMIASANAFEAQLAGEIGSDRARAFRRTWGGVNLAPGCP